MIDLVKIKEIFDDNFTPPFLDAGIVTTRLTPEGDELTITIGEREVTFTEAGDVVDAGTSFLVSLEMRDLRSEERPHLLDIPPEILEKMQIFDAEQFKKNNDD